MSLRSAFWLIGSGIFVAAALSGCEYAGQTGFVELKRGVGLTGNDVFLLNSTEIAGLAQKDHLIIQEAAGAATLRLKRDEQKLCDFQIKKNRVVTVVVSYSNMAMRCTVQS